MQCCRTTISFRKQSRRRPRSWPWRKRMLGALHGDGHGDVTIAENLDRETATDSALGNQRVNGNLAASGNSSPRAETLTTWYSFLNGLLKPRSFGRRMYSGSWPPSKPDEPGSASSYPCRHDPKSYPWSLHHDRCEYGPSWHPGRASDCASAGVHLRWP